MVKVIDKAQLEQAVQLDHAAIDCIENAFALLATKSVVMPPIMRLDIVEYNGEVDVKSAYVPGIDSFAIKMSPGFFDNPKLGLPSLNGLVVLFSAKTGLVEAVLLDQGYLTVVRTAAAGGVAVRHLSNTDDSRIAIVGTGDQARQQLQAACLVRDIKHAFVWGRDHEKASAFADEMASLQNISVTPCDSVEQAIGQAEIIVTTTPSQTPLIKAGILRAGQTVIAMGSDAEHKQEVSAEVFQEIDQYVCDSQQQTMVLGELHHAISSGIVDASENFPSLGQVVVAKRTVKPIGRQSTTDVVLCDLTGTGVQDTAIATFAYQRL